MYADQVIKMTMHTSILTKIRNVKINLILVATDQELRPVPVWTSNKRTVPVPQKFLKQLGIESPTCRSELASDVLILAINWLNADIKLDKESNPSASFKPSRPIVDKLPDFIIEANNTMLYRTLLQLKQLLGKSKRLNEKICEPIADLYRGICALLAFKINITQSREELLEKFSATAEEMNKVQDDIQLLQSDSIISTSPAETFINVDNSIDTDGKASTGLINLEIDDQFSGQGSVRIRPGKPMLKSNSLMSMGRDKDVNSNPTTTSNITSNNNKE